MTHCVRLRRRVLTLSVLLGVLTSTARADAVVQDAVTLELQALARDVHSILMQEASGALSVGQFNASDAIEGSCGPEIQWKLTECLTELGVSLARDEATYRISGIYEPFQHPRTGLHGVKLTARLSAREGDRPLTRQPAARFLFGEETVPRLLGLNGVLSPTRDPQKRSEQWEALRKRPQSYTDGLRVSTREESLFGLQVKIKSGDNWVPVPARVKDSEPFVEIPPQAEYAVELINSSNFEVAVSLSIDGINSFQFSDEPTRYWILRPHHQVLVPGWHRNDQTSSAFKLVEFPESAAARLQLQPSRSTGLITAAFSASWETMMQRPADEPGGPTRGAATGFGGDVAFRTKTVRRTIGRVREVITVRYAR